jgi:hypothetical protein
MWDKTNLPLDLNEYTRVLAAEKNHAFLADYFRCWLLEKYGGVYLDADIEILNGEVFRRIYDETQSAPDYDMFIGTESDSTGKLTAHSMGVKDGVCNPLLSFMMHTYETAFSGPLHHIIKRFDMPFLMSVYFLDKEKKGENPGSGQGVFKHLQDPLVTQGIKIYPTRYFSPLTYRGDRQNVSSFSQETCMCHHFAGTWMAGSDGVRRYKLFQEALSDGDYSVRPDLVKVVRQAYPGLRFKALKPLWRLKERHIASLEGVLNRLIPYGSPLFSFFKGKE